MTTNESRAGRSGALALVHCAFLPPLRVTPSPSEHPRARPSASHHCKPVRDAPAHRGPSPPNSTEIQRPSQPLSLGDTSQQGPPVARPQHLEGSGETEHWFLSPVSPSQERGVGSPTFTKGLIAMTPVGVGWSGEDVESPQDPSPRKKRLSWQRGILCCGLHSPHRHLAGPKDVFCWLGEVPSCFPGLSFH